MAELKFEVGERPKVTRNAAPNPFTDVVAQALKATEEQAVYFTTPMGDTIERKRKTADNPDGTETVYSEVEKCKRLLRAAAPEGKTVRVRVEEDAPKKGEARVAFWVTDKIERPRKTSQES